MGVNRGSVGGSVAGLELGANVVSSLEVAPLLGT